MRINYTTIINYVETMFAWKCINGENEVNKKQEK